MKRTELEAEVKRLEKAFLDEREQHLINLAKADRMQMELAHMTTEATAAQNGLTPYVYALQYFAAWLKKTPRATRPMVIGKMTELGIWDVRVGYDPKQDITRSIISARGPLALS
jgi:hypothetical protein